MKRDAYSQVQFKNKEMKAGSARSDCRQKAIPPPERGRIALSANERIAEFLDFAIQAKFAYVNKLSGLSPFFLMGKMRRKQTVLDGRPG